MRDFNRPIPSILTEVLANGVEQYFLAENGIKVPGEPAFYLLSHLNRRASDYGIDLGLAKEFGWHLKAA